MDHLNAIQAFYAKHPEVMNDIKRVLGRYAHKISITVLYKISQHPEIFTIYANASFKKFLLIEDALDNESPKDITLLFSKLGLYGVFTEVEYYQFCKIFDPKMHVQQIIRVNNKQKLIFLYYGRDKEIDIPVIRKCVKDSLSYDCYVDLSHDPVEITVEKTYNNHEDALKAYNKLFNYIYDLNIQTDRYISQIALHKVREYIFIQPYLNWEELPITHYDAVKSLKNNQTSPAGPLDMFLEYDNILGNR